MSEDRNQIIAEAILLGGLAAGTVLCHQSGLAPIQTLGSFFGLIALGLAYRVVQHLAKVKWSLPIAGRTVDIPALIGRLAPPLFVVGLALALLYPASVGEMPLSRDHPVHLFKSWHFWEEMLLEGRLRGWSNYWFLGYPAQELYPIGPDAWVALFRAATLGLLSWSSTYALAFTGALTLTAYAIYAFGKRHLGVLAGVVAAALWLLDPGEPREGGWAYIVDFGVWGQILGTGFFVLALARLDDVLERGKLTDYAITGAFVGLAFLSHPMNLVLFAIGVPLYGAARLLLEAKRDPARDITSIVSVFALGTALASFWLLPILSRGTDWSVNQGELWRPIALNAIGLLDGTVFRGVWPFAIFTALLGALIGVAKRRWVVVFLTAMGLFLLFLASSSTFRHWDLLSISASLSKLQYQRFSIPSKVCLYLMAGFAVSQIRDMIRAHRASAPSERAPWRGVAALLIIAAIVAPFIRPGVMMFPDAHLKGVSKLTLADDLGWWEGYQEMLAWSAQEQKESDGFYRISYEFREHEHIMMDAPVYNNTPVYKPGYTPAKLFKHAPQGNTDAIYTAASVKYVVTRRTIQRPSFKPHKNFGTVRVYRFTKYRPERYTLTGQGEVEVLEFAEERVRLRITGASPDARLRLHVANYPRWRVTMNGVEVEPDEVPAIPGGPPMLMEVPVQDGELEFEFVMRGVDWLGALLSWLALAALALCVIASRRAGLAERLDARLKKPAKLLIRVVPWVVLVVALAVAGFLISRWWKGEGRDGQKPASVMLSEDLSDAVVTYRNKTCDDWEEDKWRCSKLDWHYVGPTKRRFDGVLTPCIWASPVNAGPLAITFPQVMLGKRLIGHHGLEDDAVKMGGEPVSLELSVNGDAIKTVERKNASGWGSFDIDTTAMNGEAVDLTVTVTGGDTGRWGYCFELEVRN